MSKLKIYIFHLPKPLAELAWKRSSNSQGLEHFIMSNLLFWLLQFSYHSHFLFLVSILRPFLSDIILGMLGIGSTILLIDLYLFLLLFVPLFLHFPLLWSYLMTISSILFYFLFQPISLYRILVVALEIIICMLSFSQST